MFESGCHCGSAICRAAHRAMPEPMQLQIALRRGDCTHLRRILLELRSCGSAEQPLVEIVRDQTHGPHCLGHGNFRIEGSMIALVPTRA